MFKTEKAEWIWAQDACGKDVYADFLTTFSWDGKTRTELFVSADSDYAAYLNGALIACTQYPDYPNDKVGDVIELTPHLLEGENRLTFTVWSYGMENQSYIRSDAGLLFEVRANGEVLAHSSEETFSRVSPAYVAGECKKLTPQLGISFHFDNRKNDGFHESGKGDGFAKSVTVPSLSRQIRERPIKRLTVGEHVSGKVVQQGQFFYTQHTDNLGRDMQSAALSYAELVTMSGSHRREIEDGITLCGNGGDGVYFIVDLGEELVGFLDFDLETDRECRVDVAWGEHLFDGRCRTGVRNLTCAFEATAGRNVYLNPFRRLGCRYLEFFVHTHSAKLNAVGVRPVSYPLNYKNYQSGNLLRDTVYRVCQRTLDACMHVHYEDCPWREQALYTMDSRNQMLCGYYAFGETAFPRACLDLMTNGLREDGLLTLCFPSETSFITIPSFSLVWFLQMKEYIDYTGDLSLAQEHYAVMTRVMDAFTPLQNSEGLLNNPDGKYVWNFYEWSDTMDGARKDRPNACEAPLNAFYSVALQSFAAICERLGKADEAARLAAEAQAINRRIAARFYDPVARLFKTSDDVSRFSVLTNSLCLYCGAASTVDLQSSNVLTVLASNSAADTGLDVVPDTLSMVGFRYDALLATDRERFKNVILEEIDRVYLDMLRGGATTFWETILGERDFKNAGSLCHGWSALPIYYYETLIE